MSIEIAMGRNSVVGADVFIPTVGRLAWQGISQSAEPREYTDGRELANALGLGWEVETRSLFRGGTAEERQLMVQIPYRGVFRNDNNECLGTVGRQWREIQNHQLCDLAVSVSRLGQIKISSGGVLGRGERVWVLADLGDRQIANRKLRDGSPDVINQYLLFFLAHDGRGAAKLIPVPNQFGCANALSGLIQTRSKFGWSINHTKSADKRLAETKRGIFNALRWYDQLFETLDGLEAQPFTARQMREYADKLIADLRGTIDEAKEVTERMRAKHEADAITLTKLFDEGASNIGRTKVDALNAVTEFLSHHRRRAKKGGDETRAALSKLEDEWFGSHTIKMRRRALEILKRA